MKAKHKKDYSELITRILTDFAKKQGFEDWTITGDGPDAWYHFGDYCFSFSDIWEDMTNRQAKPRRILRYHDYYIEQHFKEPKTHVINYKNWLMGII